MDQDKEEGARASRVIAGNERREGDPALRSRGHWYGTGYALSEGYTVTRPAPIVPAFAEMQAEADGPAARQRTEAEALRNAVQATVNDQRGGLTDELVFDVLLAVALDLGIGHEQDHPPHQR
jgi:hypothetical protein